MGGSSRNNSPIQSWSPSTGSFAGLNAKSIYPGPSGQVGAPQAPTPQVGQTLPTTYPQPPVSAVNTMAPDPSMPTVGPRDVSQPALAQTVGPQISGITQFSPTPDPVGPPPPTQGLVGSVMAPNSVAPPQQVPGLLAPTPAASSPAAAPSPFDWMMKMKLGGGGLLGGPI